MTIIDVAVTGTDESYRRSHVNPLQPLIIRFRQKLRFIPLAFSHNGPIHPDAVGFVCSRIDHKLGLVDDQATAAKRKSIWKLWARHVSAATNRTASRRIQRKITKMVNSSNSAKRHATSSTNCDNAFSLASKSAEELEQNVDMLSLDQHMYQSYYAARQSIP